ncbi:MAG: hypothetical protein ACM31C_09400 [Acidobacteriota bacterium]
MRRGRATAPRPTARIHVARAGTAVALVRGVRSLVILCALAATAGADGFYFTEGVGGVEIHDQVGHILPSAARLRISLGDRVGPWAVEAWLAATLPGTLDPIPTELDTWGLDLKRVEPVSRHLEVYVRGTMSAAKGYGALEGFGGRGLGFGAGIALHGKVSPWGLLWAPLFFLVRSGPMIHGALWLDDGYEFYRLRSAEHPWTLDAQMSHVTLGFALGSDF